MGRKLSIRLKLLTGFSFVSLIGILLTSVFVIAYTSDMMNKSIKSRLNDQVDRVVSSIRIAYQSNLERQKYNLQAVEMMLKGSIQTDNKKEISVTAVNQENNVERLLKIPVMTIDNEPLMGNHLFVDKIYNMLNIQCTIFQSTQAGLLRISTNIKKSDGSRAVMTYIPKDSIVYKTISSGNSYFGRAFVVDGYSVTAYAPLYDENKKIIGAIFTGLKETNMTDLKNEILSLKTVDSGFVFVLDSKGDLIIHSKNEGKNILSEKDKYGFEYIKTICHNKNGDIDYTLALSDNKEIVMTAKYKYIDEIDYIVVDCAGKKELFQDISIMGRYILLIGAVSLLLSILIAFLFARNISSAIGKIAKVIKEITVSICKAADQLNAASQAFAESASRNAAGIEEISASIMNLHDMTDENNHKIVETNQLMIRSNESLKNASVQMDNLVKKHEMINDDTKNIAKIIKTIDDIAFQTNILSLNASVEAAHAGDYGRGFAVVATQIKSLADNSSIAAKDSSEKINTSVEKIKGVSAVSETVNETIKQSLQENNKMGIIIKEVNLNIGIQKESTDQIKNSIEMINNSTQGIAASSEETAATSAELFDFVRTLEASLSDLNIFVDGGINTKNGKAIAKKSR